MECPPEEGWYEAHVWSFMGTHAPNLCGVRPKGGMSLPIYDWPLNLTGVLAPSALNPRVRREWGLDAPLVSGSRLRIRNYVRPGGVTPRHCASTLQIPTSRTHEGALCVNDNGREGEVCSFSSTSPLPGACTHLTNTFVLPSKQRDPSTDSSSAAARIRNNQRRSRARHREFVDELKAKVREYERQGVQATLDMRRVARKVALENSRLRSLLACRGVTTEEVNHYLASFDDRACESLPLTALTPQTAEVGPLPLASNLGLPRLDRDVPNGASASALDTLAVAADASVRQTCCGPTTQCSSADRLDVHGHIAKPSPRGGLLSPLPSPNTIPNTTTSHLEMSCTAAAHIMANMYRDGNNERAREALGCLGPEECLVKNTLVFQLLDSAETN